MNVFCARIDAGLGNESNFDEERDGWTAEQVWQALHQLPTRSPDLVVTHGDFSLDNLLVHDGKVASCTYPRTLTGFEYKPEVYVIN